MQCLGVFVCRPRASWAQSFWGLGLGGIVLRLAGFGMLGLRFRAQGRWGFGSLGLGFGIQCLERLGFRVSGLVERLQHREFKPLN